MTLEDFLSQIFPAKSSIEKAYGLPKNSLSKYSRPKNRLKIPERLKPKIIQYIKLYIAYLNDCVKELEDF